MNNTILRRWLIVAGCEVLLALGLAAIAPFFINSNWPIIGLLLWIGILAMVSGSGSYVLWRWHDARRGRQWFVQRFPQYRTLTTVDFLSWPSHRVAHAIQIWQDIHTDPEFQDMQMSPLDLLHRPRR